MASIVLYNDDLDDGCYRVRLMLSMLEVAHRIHAVNRIPDNGHLSSTLLDLDPLGRLPILRDGAFILHGAEAILAYLAKAYDPAGLWLPQDAAAFGATLQWLSFSASTLASATQARAVALFGLPGDPLALRAAARQALRIMDDHMTLRQIDDRDWFAGDTATIADVALFPGFALSRDFGIDHAEFPALRRWMRRFRALAGFKTMPGIPDYH
jgi:glutathione S-transferase